MDYNECIELEHLLKFYEIYIKDFQWK